MSNINDFVIENGVLRKYTGKDADVVIPDSVTSIGERAFAYCHGLESITIPNSVTSIDISAFWRCSNLQSITIPDSVTSIGEWAFADCGGLESVTIPDSVTSIGYSAFESCSNLQSITIPDLVTSIGNSTFSGCSNLQSITIPDSVTSIGNRAFWGCSNLQSVTIPDSVTNIGISAFHDCESMKDDSGFVVVKNTLFGCFSKEKNIHIPDDVTVIGAFAFTSSENIESITVPDNVTNIEPSAFCGLDSLTRIDILSSIVKLPEEKLSLFFRMTKSKPKFLDDLSVFAPVLSLAVLKDHGLGIAATRAFIEDSEKYTVPEIVDEYIKYIASQKKHLLPLIFKLDKAEIIKKLVEAKKITKKNVEVDYYQYAVNSQATKCVEYLQSVFGEVLGTVSAKPNPLWDGNFFSLDGKKLIKYPETEGETTYYIPEGTKEIGKEAFFMTPLQSVIIPESVTTIRNESFVCKGGKSLFIELPHNLGKVSERVFASGMYDEDDDEYDFVKTYYVATLEADLIPNLCKEKYDKCCYPVYTGGSIEDIDSRYKKFAVKGFLYALEHNCADMSQWKDGYLTHIKRNGVTYTKQAVCDEFLLNLMIDEKLLNESGTEKLMSAYDGNTEIIARLLAYKQQQFGDKPQKEDFTLSDNDAEIKRRIRMEKRQEEIKGQKGIEKLVFVCTGGLANFGNYNEYTGVHDLSDLKKYIEKRGGFLRSAVSSKTDYLICNNQSYLTTKLKKAQELGIAIITEEEFLKMAESEK